jgi:DNA-binding NarL/FixJ family response regulator
MFYDRFKPSITIYIISIDKVFSNQLLLKLEDDTDALVIQDDSVEEFFQEIQANPVLEETIPIILVDFILDTMENHNAKDGLEVMKEIKTLYPDWEIIIMSDLSSNKIKDDSIQAGILYHVFKNDNTGARIINRIHQIQNKYYLVYKKKMVVLSFALMVITVLLFFISRSIFYYVD